MTAYRIKGQNSVRFSSLSTKSRELQLGFNPRSCLSGVLESIAECTIVRRDVDEILVVDIGDRKNVIHITHTRHGPYEYELGSFSCTIPQCFIDQRLRNFTHIRAARQQLRWSLDSR